MSAQLNVMNRVVVNVMNRVVVIVPVANVLSRLRHARIQTRRLLAVVADRDETNRPPVVTTEPGHVAVAPSRTVTTSTRGTKASDPVMPAGRTALPMASMPRCRSAAIAKATMMRHARVHAVGDVGVEAAVAVTANPEVIQRQSRTASRSRALTMITKTMPRPK
jgi:hypothetical protein